MEGHATTLTGIALTAMVALLGGLAMTRLRQPAVVGYILAGVILGPTGFGLIESSASVTTLAELGVLMLLFLLGMELSLRAFKTVLRTALLCACLQIALSLGLTYGLGALFGWPAEQAMLLGFLVALSSTAIAVKMLDDIGELRTRTGRLTVGVLIAQDLAVVPMLVLVNGLGRAGGPGWVMVLRLVVAVGLLAALITVLSRRQRLILPTSRWLDRRPELVPLAAIAFCFTAAALSSLAGLTTAYGAFLAGLVIGSSSDRKRTIEATLPIQAILMAIFFLSIGLLIDLGFIWHHLGVILVFLVVLVIFKTVINSAALRFLGEPWERAFLAGVVMAQFGEFSFVLAAAGAGNGVIDTDGYRLAIAVIALSLLISPLWLLTARRFHAIALAGITNMRAALALTYREELRALDWTGARLVAGGRLLLAAGRRGRVALDRLIARRRLARPTPLLPPPASDRRSG